MKALLFYEGAEAKAEAEEVARGLRSAFAVQLIPRQSSNLEELVLVARYRIVESSVLILLEGDDLRARITPFPSAEGLLLRLSWLESCRGADLARSPAIVYPNRQCR